MKKIILILSFLMAIIPCNLFARDFPSKNDIYWLSQNIYHEARGESLYGKFMIGVVTLERLRCGKWGNNVKSVVTAPHQFSWYHKNKNYTIAENESWTLSQYVAIFTLSIFPEKSHNGIMYYHNKNVHPLWASKMKKITEVGNHIFYKEVK
jgi:spore germination cell wall hydrolase CwlJ-like protein